MSALEVKVPDIGDFKDVPIIEVLVKPGDSVAVDDSLVTLESDKATMDIPSPAAGTVSRIGVKAGDKVSEGSVVLTLETTGGARDGNGDGRVQVASRPGTASAPPTAELVTPAPRGEKGRADSPGEGASPTPPAGQTIEVRVPDIGDFTDVPVIEVFVKPGDIVRADDPLVTLESDKATMDVPAPIGGIVEGVRVAVGARVSKGTPLLSLKTAETGDEPASRATPPTAPDNADLAVPARPGAQPPPSTRNRRGRCSGRTSSSLRVPLRMSNRRCAPRMRRRRSASSRASSASIWERSAAADRRGGSCTTTCSASSRTRLPSPR